MTTLLVTGIRQVPGGIAFYGHKEGDLSERLYTVSVPAAEAVGIIGPKKTMGNETLALEVEDGWLIPVLIPRETAA